MSYEYLKGPRRHSRPIAMDNQKDKTLAATERPTPSQAEGERDGAVKNLPDRPVPSQAEGDLKTIEEDIKKK